jgi:Immune inhibitor A-like, MAM domain
VRKIVFKGVSELPSLPLEWVVDSDPPAQPGDPAFYAGTGDNLDRGVVHEVDVPAGSPELTFDTDWSLEEGYDYAYAQISTDGGVTYESLSCSDQVDGPLGPAWNGESGGFVAESCDLAPWAGQTVVLAFRMVTDQSVHYDGFWVDDVAIDGTVLSDGSSLSGWDSPTGYRPTPIDGYTVRLIAYRHATGPVKAMRHHHGHGATIWMRTLHLNPHFKGVLKVKHAVFGHKGVIAAIVTYHDPTEQVMQYAPYELFVNGHLQPGGA